MQKIKDYINIELKKLEDSLKQDDQGKREKEDFIAHKNELLDMLFLIDFSRKYNINRRTFKKALILPRTSMSFAEYRIMDDFETEERKYWKELEIDGETLRLYGYDIVIKTKTDN